MQGWGQGRGQNLSGPYGQESGLRAGLRILIDFHIARGGLPPQAQYIGIRQRRGQNLREPYTLSQAPVPKSIVRSLL